MIVIETILLAIFFLCTAVTFVCLFVLLAGIFRLPEGWTTDDE